MMFFVERDENFRKDGFSVVSLFDSGLDEIDFNSAKAF